MNQDDYTLTELSEKTHRHILPSDFVLPKPSFKKAYEKTLEEEDWDDTEMLSLDEWLLEQRNKEKSRFKKVLYNRNLRAKS